MRLLKYDENGELRLTKDLIDNIPPYAILSHTWGTDDEEITFDELKNGLEKSKAGYYKIQFCGEQARKDGLEHFWVDTCCIDKANHAELSEAITSMFRWYQRAVKCYVYLSDVQVGNKDNTQTGQTWESDFRGSRWFTRGWTLQELLAPPSLEFFSWDRKLLGSRKTLEGLVQEITQIPIRALQGGGLSSFSDDERLRWAAGRKTKRPEDRAYCLLGIFDVFMPLIYGEGDNAFKRLKEEINKRPGKISPPSPSAIIPFRRDRDFIARPVLDDVWQRASEPGARVGLVGLGGVGKSQITIEYAYRCREADPMTWVFWVHASSVTRFKESYRKIAERLQLKGWNEPKADVLGTVYSWLSEENNGPWRMVVDNADSSRIMFEPWNGGTGTQTVAESTDDSPVDYLPICPHGSIVVTSRSREVVEGLVEFGEDILDVRPMEEEVAVALLRKKMKKQEWCDGTNDVIGLVRQLDCMPLAITQAPAYINQCAPRVTVSGYVEMLKDHHGERATLLQKDIRDPRRDG